MPLLFTSLDRLDTLDTLDIADNIRMIAWYVSCEYPATLELIGLGCSRGGSTPFSILHRNVRYVMPRSIQISLMR